MEELYWITRLDRIIDFVFFLTVISGIIILGCILYLPIAISNDEVNSTTFIKKALKYCSPICIIMALLLVFIPTTKETLMIYGVGNAIEYLKTNDKAKQLPDKCIDALDAWVESLNEDKKSNN